MLLVCPAPSQPQVVTPSVGFPGGGLKVQVLEHLEKSHKERARECES